MKSPALKTPSTPEALTVSSPKTPSSKSKKNKKQKKEKQNKSFLSKSGVKSLDRGTKRRRDSRSDESEAEITTPEKIIPDSKRAKIQEQSSGTPLTSRSSDSSSKKPSSGQKVIILGAIRKRLAELDARTLYVRKLPRNTTIAQLKTLCPTSVSAQIKASERVNRRKHAFVVFKSGDAARAALESINGKLVADRPVVAELCSERHFNKMDADSNEVAKHTHWIAPNNRTIEEFCLTTLYISCIPRVTTQDEIRDVFPKALSFDFKINTKHNIIGSCRVIFSNEEDALEAFNSKHGTLLHDCPLIVNFAFKKRHGRALKQGTKNLTASTVSSAGIQSVAAKEIKVKKPKPKLLPASSCIQKSKKLEGAESSILTVPPVHSKTQAVNEQMKVKKKAGTNQKGNKKRKQKQSS